LLGVAFAGIAQGADESSAVILLYHHVSEDTPSSTSVSPALFEAHLDYLAEHNYEVLPLTKITSALQNQRPLPERSVAITFDDGYKSILTEALPRLSERGWPFTVFVSTDAIDQGFGNFLSWDELRRLESAGATIANHTASHDHLVRRFANESEHEWQQRIVADIQAGAKRLSEELKHPAQLFAWPYGEFDSALERLADGLGYVAFGQQSGPLGPSSSLQSLPRFPMAAAFASLDTLPEKLRSRPLPVTVLAPKSRLLGASAPSPTLTIRIADGPYQLDALRCYVAGQEPAAIERDGDELMVTAQQALGPGRSKYNCTAPSASESGVYYWYSYLWLQPKSDGSWYEE
jgi:peptidoglycan/xylan/chitin deacetylase (PgdA/CDA1 family)